MYLGRPETIVVRLFDSIMNEYEGQLNPLSPLIGLTYDDDIVVSYWQQRESSFTNLELTEENFRELGNGFYAIDLPAFTEAGSAKVFISGNIIRDVEVDLNVKPLPISMALPPRTCVITGNIADLTGEISRSEQIRFRIANVPKHVGQSIVTSRVITTTPDAFGNFSVALIYGATVLVEIPQCGIRSQIEVPEVETVSLLDLIPQLP